MKKIPSPLRYPGGKSRAIDKIIPLIPATIKEYREPFVGGGSVFLAVKCLFGNWIEKYWINDLNFDLYCYWLYARDDIDRLVEAVIQYKTDFGDGRSLHQYFTRADVTYTDFERAVRFFIMNRITFSGVMDAGGYSQQAYETRFTDSSIQRLGDISACLKGTQITHSDYATLLFAPGEQTFIFLDPPYYSATKSKLYGVKGKLHTSFDHQRFADNMRKCTHRWLITYDDSPTIRALFSFADIVEWELQYGMNNYMQGKADKGKELFIKNY